MYRVLFAIIFSVCPALAEINVRSVPYRAKGDNVSDDYNAITMAISDAKTAGVTVFFPAGSYYSSKEIRIENPQGLTIRGEGRKATWIRGAVGFYGTSGSGSANNVTIDNLGIQGNPALRLDNVLWVALRDLMLYGTLDVQGSGNIVASNCQVYGYQSPALDVGNGNGTRTNSGPLTVIGGQISSHYAPAVRVGGSGSMSISFLGTMFSAQNHPTTVQVDGRWTHATFDSCHGESNWDTTSSGQDFLIGSVSKPAVVVVRGGSYWGHGNGTYRRLYWMRVASVGSLVIEGVLVSRLLWPNGYDGGVIHLDSQPDSLDIRSVNRDSVTSALVN